MFDLEGLAGGSARSDIALCTRRATARRPQIGKDVACAKRLDELPANVVCGCVGHDAALMAASDSTHEYICSSEKYGSGSVVRRFVARAVIWVARGRGWLLLSCSGMGGVHVYSLSLDGVDDVSMRRGCEDVLSPDECARRDQLMFEHHRREFVFAHGLVRYALSRHAPWVPPKRWELVPTAKGRPEVSGPSGAPRLRFNLSHTDGLVACAVADAGEVGIDVEAADRSFAEDDATLKLADRYFTRREVEALRPLQREERRRRFMEYWTLKESYIKARGCGMSLPLDRFYFELSANRVDIAFSPGFDDQSSRWHFALRSHGPRHLLAVAAGVTPGMRPLNICETEDGRGIITA